MLNTKTRVEVYLEKKSILYAIEQTNQSDASEKKDNVVLRNE